MLDDLFLFAAACIVAGFAFAAWAVVMDVRDAKRAAAEDAALAARIAEMLHGNAAWPRDLGYHRLIAYGRAADHRRR